MMDMFVTQGHELESSSNIHMQFNSLNDYTDN